MIRRSVSVLTAVVLATAGVLVAGGPASARPNCDVANPPPICGTVDPVAALPDLTVAITGPAAAVGGTVAAYTVRVANPSGANAASAPRASVRVTVGGGATFAAAGSCSVAGATATCALSTIAVGAGVSIPVSVNLPAAAVAVVVTATADPAGVIEERSETNNTSSLTTAVSAPALPDLRMSMTGPAAVRGVYASGVWTMTVTNAGSAPAAIVDVRWLTNWGGSVNANAVKSGAIGFSCIVPPEYLQQLVYCYGTGALQPGASAVITITAVPPAAANVYGTAGQSVVTATVDYGQRVAESNEANNAATVVTTILP